ncbi:glycosyltransferase, partial [Parasynechococcus sp.]|uniref:glycosyltransferase n=1 Tax=Parasynechococcus sp. TaxID=3101203 RepID=UPI0037039A51
MTLALLEPLLFLAAAGSAAAGLLILQLGLQRMFAVAPRLKAARAVAATETSLAVVIPAFNEAHNIEAYVASVLASEPPCRDGSVLVVDDESTDATVENAIRAGSAASHFRLIQAGPRPVNERWVGKNWACSKAVDQVSSDWLLFIDADVRLKPDALQRALAQALDDEADLLSLGFPILETNDPASPVAFAAGPFMLFKASTYAQIGGHRALAGEVVEDLALAR